MKRVLVTGGAGYVGTQSVLHFRELGWRVVTVDDLSRGHEEFGQHSTVELREGGDGLRIVHAPGAAVDDVWLVPGAAVVERAVAAWPTVITASR